MTTDTHQHDEVLPKKFTVEQIDNADTHQDVSFMHGFNAAVDLVETALHSYIENEKREAYKRGYIAAGVDGLTAERGELGEREND